MLTKPLVIKVGTCGLVLRVNVTPPLFNSPDDRQIRVLHTGLSPQMVARRRVFLS